MISTYEHLTPEYSLHGAKNTDDSIHHELGDAVHAEVPEVDCVMIL